MDISRAAFDLIVAEEVSSKAAYERLYRRTEWPGASSGVTIGIGYDVGYSTPARLKADWGGQIPNMMIDTLAKACGVTGMAAKPIAERLRPQIDVPWAAAISVFENVDVPRWTRTVRDHLVNEELLGPDALGALVSLAYNRGPSFNTAGDRYREMRSIRAHMASKDFDAIPGDFRSMERLWPNLKGLRDRREHEAQLFERGISTDIRDVLASTMTPPANTNPRPVIALGSQGEFVKEAQRKLNVTPDGDFGPKTEAAVEAFQKSHGLSGDGKVGHYTWEALDAA